MTLEHYTHRLSNLQHLHEAWCRRIHDSVYKDRGTVLTYNQVMQSPLFKEFPSAAAAVMSLHFGSTVTVSSAWATLVRPTVESGWHTHRSHRFILVYYPQAQEDSGDLLIAENEDDTNTYTRVTPVEGLCVLFRGVAPHKIEPNTSKICRYSLVALGNPK